MSGTSNFGSQSVEDLLNDEGKYNHLRTVSFNEEYGDPIESEHTDLDAAPERAIIDFGEHGERECGIPFIIKRAMVDPDATVRPIDDG